MNTIQSMIHQKLGEVRIIRSEDGNPMNTLFCATDVCRALCYNENNIRTIISRQCSGVTKRDATDSIGRVQSINFIPLYDVFALIYNSRKPEAIEFRDWVNKDVLPSLYQFGTYNVDNHIDNLQFTNPVFDVNNVDSYKDLLEDYHKPDEELKKHLRIQDKHISEEDMRLLYGVGLIMNDLLGPMRNELLLMKNQISQLSQQNKNLIVPATIIKKEDK